VKRIFLVLIIGCCNAGSPAEAQDAKYFYEQNYATETFEKNYLREQRQNEKGTSNSDTPNFIESKNDLSVADTTKSFAALNEKDEKKGETPDWIGLVLSTKNRSHVNTVLGELKSLARQFDYRVGHLYFVGDISAALSYGQEIAELVARGAVVEFPQNIPEQYDLKRSPSWIVSLQKGEVILDGVMSLNTYLNSDGEFIGDIYADKKD